MPECSEGPRLFLCGALFSEKHAGCMFLKNRLDKSLVMLAHNLQVHTGNGLSLDFLAFALSLALTVLLILGTHETSLFNLGRCSPLAAPKGDHLIQCLPVLGLLQLPDTVVLTNACS